MTKGEMTMRKLLTMLLALMLPLAACAEAATDFSALYPDKFLPEGSEPIRTDSSYQSDDVNLTITTQRLEQSDVYVVDIYVRSVECFQRAFGGDEWNTITERVRVLSEKNDAIVAMTGDSGQYFSFGWRSASGRSPKYTDGRFPLRQQLPFHQRSNDSYHSGL